MNTRVCPKCSKDFSTNPYWTADLKRHMARKNSCIRGETQYIREARKEVTLKPVLSLAEMEMPENLTGSIYDITVRVLEMNDCVVMPNRDALKLVFITNDHKVETSVSDFIQYMWMDFMVPKLFKGIKTDPGLFGGLDMNSSPNSCLIIYTSYIEGSDFFRQLRSRLIGFFKTKSREERTLLARRIAHTPVTL